MENFPVSQTLPGLGAGVTNALQVGGDPGQGLLGPDIVYKKKGNLGGHSGIFRSDTQSPACLWLFAFFFLTGFGGH